MKIVSRYQLKRLGTRLLSAGLLSAEFIGATGLLSTIALGHPLLGDRVAANEPQQPIQLRNNGTAEARGVTAGERSLAEMAGRDRRRKVCLGYAAAEPDHQLILTQSQPRLRIAVSSEGADTTLLILGPRGIDCNDNYRRDHRDAAVTARNWPAGNYQIWVGSFEAGDRIDYQLRITNPNNGPDSGPDNSPNNGPDSDANGSANNSSKRF